MKSKKLVSLLFIVLFVFSVSIAVSAANENYLKYTVVSSDTIVYSGDTITVDLWIDGNTGFVWSRVDVHYNPEVLTFVEDAAVRVEIGADGKEKEFIKPEAVVDTVVNPDKLSLNDNAGNGDRYVTVVTGSMSAAMDPGNAELFNKTGKVITLTFKVKAGYEGPLSFTTTGDPMNTYSAKGEFFTKEGLDVDNESVLTCIDEATHVHTEEIIPGKAATCTEPGLTDGKKCTVCLKTYEEQKTIDPKGHLDDVKLDAVAPTCTATGLTEGTKCSVCQTITKAQETVPAKGHDWEKTAGTAATCTAEGKKDLWTCKVCQTVDTENNGAAIEKLAHSLAKDYVNTDSKEHWQKCQNCDHTENKAAHTFKNGVCSVCGYGCSHKGGKATCSSKATCELCGAKYGSTLAHTPGAAATCTEDQKCTVCSTVLKKATGHTLEDHAAKAATCTEKGHNAYQTCKNCTYTTYAEVAATGHTLEDHAAKAATCTEKGHNAYQTCKNCDYTTFEEVAATGHDLEDHAAKEPTCAEKGNKAYQTCKNCDYTTYEEIAATGNHTYGEWETVKEATTKAEGEKKHTCTVCGAAETESIPMLEETGLPIWLIIVIAVGAAAVIAVVVILIVRKKKQN